MGPAAPAGVASTPVDTAADPSVPHRVTTMGRVVNPCVPDVVLSAASSDDAAGMVGVIHAAFGARRPLNPPSTAVNETTESVTAVLAAGGGIYATVAGQPAGVILLSPKKADLAGVQRVSVHPDFQRHGIASAMVEAIMSYAAELGYRRLELFARAELAELIDFWQHRDFVVDRRVDHGVILTRVLPITLSIPTAEAMHDLGRQLAQVLQAGDLVIATGGLGAGKTTLTQGIGQGLQVDGVIISPTFVLSRVHRSRSGRPTLVHVDAYRLSGPAEVDDLDLDASMDDSVTVVEWGEGLVEGLASHRLEIDIRRSGDEDDETRLVVINLVGDRWQAVDLASLDRASLDHASLAGEVSRVREPEVSGV